MLVFQYAMSNLRTIRFSIWFPVSYLLICLGVWISFTLTNHDGLANFGLALITMPLSAIERALTYQIFGSFEQLPLWKPLLLRIGLPSGYLMDHAYWFIPLASLQAYFLFIVGRWLEKFYHRKLAKKSS